MFLMKLIETAENLKSKTSEYQLTSKKSFQRGAVLAFFAVGLPAFVAITGLVLELGHLYFEQSDLENDAEAIARNIGSEIVAKKNQSAIEKYNTAYNNYETARNNYNTAMNKYNTDLADYNSALTKYNNEVIAYNAKVAEHNAKVDNYKTGDPPISEFKEPKPIKAEILDNPPEVPSEADLIANPKPNEAKQYRMQLIDSHSSWDDSESGNIESRANDKAKLIDSDVSVVGNQSTKTKGDLSDTVDNFSSDASAYFKFTLTKSFSNWFSGYFGKGDNRTATVIAMVTTNGAKTYSKDDINLNSSGGTLDTEEEQLDEPKSITKTLDEIEQERNTEAIKRSNYSNDGTLKSNTNSMTGALSPSKEDAANSRSFFNRLADSLVGRWRGTSTEETLKNTYDVRLKPSDENTKLLTLSLGNKNYEKGKVQLQRTWIEKVLLHEETKTNTKASFQVDIDGALTKKVTETYNGVEDHFFYIRAEGDISTSITINVNQSNVMPLIFTYEGTAPIILNIADGAVFHGMIYAPNTTVTVNRINEDPDKEKATVDDSIFILGSDSALIVSKDANNYDEVKFVTPTDSELKKQVENLATAVKPSS